MQSHFFLITTMFQMGIIKKNTLTNILHENTSFLISDQIKVIRNEMIV